MVIKIVEFWLGSGTSIIEPSRKTLKTIHPNTLKQLNAIVSFSCDNLKYTPLKSPELFSNVQHRKFRDLTLAIYSI